MRRRVLNVAEEKEKEIVAMGRWGGGEYSYRNGEERRDTAREGIRGRRGKEWGRGGGGDWEESGGVRRGKREGTEVGEGGMGGSPGIKIYTCRVMVQTG
jgi:hypothetical protein